MSCACDELETCHSVLLLTRLVSLGSGNQAIFQYLDAKAQRRRNVAEVRYGWNDRRFCFSCCDWGNGYVVVGSQSTTWKSSVWDPDDSFYDVVMKTDQKIRKNTIVLVKTKQVL